MAAEIRGGDDGYRPTEIDWTQATSLKGDRTHIVSITRPLTDLRKEVPFLDGVLPDIQRIFISNDFGSYASMVFETPDGQTVFAHELEGARNNELGTMIFVDAEADVALETERLKRYLRLDKEHILWTRAADAESINK